MGYVTIAILQFILVLFIFLALPLWSKTEKTLQLQYHKTISNENQNSGPSEAKLDPILSLRGVKSVLLSFFLYCAIESTPIYPCMLHDTPARYGKKNAQRLMGIQMAVAYSSFTFLPPIFGFVASKLSMAIYPFVILVYVIIIIISSERVNRIIGNGSK